MAGRRQFSLGYLFLETFWIAATLGCIVQALRAPPSFAPLHLLLFPAAALFAGAAIGGLFGGMKRGFVLVLTFMVTLVLSVIVVLIARLAEHLLLGT
jgi:hypothetical protein